MIITKKQTQKSPTHIGLKTTSDNNEELTRHEDFEEETDGCRTEARTFLLVGNIY